MSNCTCSDSNFVWLHSHGGFYFYLYGGDTNILWNVRHEPGSEKLWVNDKKIRAMCMMCCVL